MVLYRTMVLYQQVATRRCDLLVPRSTQDSRTVSLIMTCAFDEVAAPHAHFHSSCYKFVGLAATLRECGGGVSVRLMASVVHGRLPL